MSFVSMQSLMHYLQTRGAARRGGKREKAKKRVVLGPHHWHRRIIKEMQQSPRIQELARKGLLDQYYKF